jgi:hypothetical protein
MTTKTPFQARQGDVFIIEIEEKDIPDGAKVKKPEGGKHILELGTVTGHAHAIPASKNVEVLVDGEKKYLKLAASAELQHDEHAEIKLPKGIYEVRRQCTWSAVDQMSSMVAD